MQSETPKQYLSVAGHTLLQHSLERVGGLPEIARIVVAIGAADDKWPAVASALRPELAAKVLVATGGAERMQSVLNALTALQPFAHGADWVLVHDAVRPCVHGWSKASGRRKSVRL